MKRFITILTILSLLPSLFSCGYFSLPKFVFPDMELPQTEEQLGEMLFPDEESSKDEPMQEDTPAFEEIPTLEDVPTPEETPIPEEAPPETDITDYNDLTGYYMEGDEDNGPLYCLELVAAADGLATFNISYAGYNFSPLYFTESITAPLIDGYYVFDWSDSWGNSGTGRFSLHDSAIPYVCLEMTVTAEAEWNRGSLATDGFKTLYLSK